MKKKKKKKKKDNSEEVVTKKTNKGTEMVNVIGMTHIFFFKKNFRNFGRILMYCEA